MFSFFGLFGRSREQQRLDHALRDAGIHPRLVPEAIKLTTLKLLKESGEQAADHECAAAAEILVYCLLGPGVYAEQNGGIRTDAAEARIEAAIVAELWEAWKNKTPFLRQDGLLLAADSECLQLLSLFADNPAWGTMIQSGRRHGGKSGTYCLYPLPSKF